MKKIIILAAVAATALLASCNSTSSTLLATVGSVMQKEIVVDGKTVTKDFCVKNIILYNSDGHTIRFKDKNGRDEKYSGKDSKKTKPKKSAKGVIREYDANGKEIYYKSPGGYEKWTEYDANGNETHTKDSNGSEDWSEYNGDGKMIHYKTASGRENWYEYDDAGNEIHAKHTNSDSILPDSGFEEWWEYDDKGNQIYYKSTDGIELWFEYTFWENGNRKTRTAYEAL